MNYNPLPAIPRITHAPKKSNHRVGRTVFMGTALIYLQSSAKGLCEIYFWNNCAFVFCGEGEKMHFEIRIPFHK